MQSIAEADLDLRYWRDFLPQAEAEQLFDALLASIAWQQGEVRIFGRTIAEPRLSAWYGDPGADYAYSGKQLSPSPWTSELRMLRERLLDFLRSAGQAASFNSVLLNLYRDGSDSIGWHSDAEAELGPEPLIASISLGVRRRFMLRHKAEPARRHELSLAPGSLLLMAGPTQARWQHALPKTKACHEPRINLTFRQIVNRG